jgi:hypothetical protein
MESFGGLPWMKGSLSHPTMWFLISKLQAN